MSDAPAGALAGLRVLDLTQMLAGPYCTMMLADQGADVVKIEPIGGDPTRTFGPFDPSDNRRHFGGYFQSTNRNKKSIAIDLKAEEGKAIFRRLARDTDVVAENFRAGVMDRLGLSYESLAQANPRLVYGALRGFGDPRTGESPYVDWPAFDVVAQAMGGPMGITGPDADTPMKIGPGIGDIVPAMQTAFAIVAAVWHAARTGEGQFVDVAMYDGNVALAERIIYQHAYDGTVPGPEGNHHPLLCPFGIFKAKDGWVTVACPRDSFWAVLVEIMESPDLATDPRFATNDARLENADRTNRLVEDWTSRHTKEELKGILGGRVPFGPVHTVADIYADPHLAARDMLKRVEHPGVDRPVTIANTPIRMTRTNFGIRERAPIVGEHTDARLQAAGFTTDYIADARARGIVA